MRNFLSTKKASVLATSRKARSTVKTVVARVFRRAVTSTKLTVSRTLRAVWVGVETLGWYLVVGEVALRIRQLLVAVAKSPVSKTLLRRGMGLSYFIAGCLVWDIYRSARQHRLGADIKLVRSTGRRLPRVAARYAAKLIAQAVIGWVELALAMAVVVFAVLSTLIEQTTYVLAVTLGTPSSWSVKLSTPTRLLKAYSVALLRWLLVYSAALALTPVIKSEWTPLLHEPKPAKGVLKLDDPVLMKYSVLLDATVIGRDPKAQGHDLVIRLKDKGASDFELQDVWGRIMIITVKSGLPRHDAMEMSRSFAASLVTA